MRQPRKNCGSLNRLDREMRETPRIRDGGDAYYPSSARATASGSLAITVSNTCAALSGRCAPLLPISNRSERQVEARGEFFLRQIELLTQSAHAGHASRTCKLGVRRRRSILVRYSGAMALLFAHSVEGTPIRIRWLLRIELKLRDISFFMRLRSSCGDDANDLASHRAGDEEHSAIDQADHVEAQLARRIEIIELDREWIQEHPRGGLEVVYSNSGASSICGTSTRPLSVMRISGMTDSGIRLKPM